MFQSLIDQYSHAEPAEKMRLGADIHRICSESFQRDLRKLPTAAAADELVNNLCIKNEQQDHGASRLKAE